MIAKADAKGKARAIGGHTARSALRASETHLMPTYLEEPRMAAFVTLTLVAAFVLFCRALRKLGTGYGYIPSAELLRSLIAKPRGDKGLPDVRVRQITCCQIIIGFIGIGGAAGWLLTQLLLWLCEWSGGSAVWLLASCWIVSTLEGMCNGFLPHIERWVERNDQRQLLLSPGSMVAPIAAFTFTISQLGPDPVGKLVLLLVCGVYHCCGALSNYDAFLSKCAAGRYSSSALSAANDPAAWLHSYADQSDEVQSAIYDGLTPYGRFGLGLGLALYAVLPLVWLVLGAIAILALYRVSRLLTVLRGLPAICFAIALALGFYVSLTMSWEPEAYEYM